MVVHLTNQRFRFRILPFFNRSVIVLSTRSQIEGALSLYLEKCCIFLCFSKTLKNRIKKSAPLSDSILGIVLFEFVRIMENLVLLFQ